MNNEKQKWWYGFDPNTFKYAGMRLSVEKPDNATDVSIAGIIDPIWNSETKQWDGANLADQLAELQHSNDDSDDVMDSSIAGLVSVVADLQDTVNTSVSSLMSQVAQLKANLGNDTSAPTDVSVTTTADSASVTDK